MNRKLLKVERRTVQTIKETLEPKQIFDLISSKEWPYSTMYLPEYPIRDRAGMALSFLTVARVTEIFGGKKYRRCIEGGTLKTVQVLSHGVIKEKQIIKGGKEKPEAIGRHIGLKCENLEVTENFLFITNMPIVKRSCKVIEKYGPQVAQRDRLAFPLKTGLFDSVFYDQLVPFTWLVMEYLEKYAPEKGKLFPYQDCRAWQIINHCTGKFPNWFRAQADRFYGWYITRDSVKHSKFVGRVKAESSMPYIRYTWSDDLKEKSMAMDFTWIEKTVDEIKGRI